MGRCTNYGAGRNNQTTQENENIENPINETAQVQGQGLGRGRGQGMGGGMRKGMGNGPGNGMGQNRGGRSMRRSGGGGGRGTGMGRRFRDDIQEQPLNGLLNNYNTIQALWLLRACVTLKTKQTNYDKEKNRNSDG